MREVDDFLKGDHSHMPPDEYAQEQKRMMARQSMAMAALLQAVGFEEKKPLMQSEDMVDLKRRAGITEDYQDYTTEFMKIVDLAQGYMYTAQQSWPERQNASSVGTAVDIKRIAEQIIQRYTRNQ